MQTRHRLALLVLLLSRVLTDAAAAALTAEAWSANRRFAATPSAFPSSPSITKRLLLVATGTFSLPGLTNTATARATAVALWNSIEF